MSTLNATKSRLTGPVTVAPPPSLNRREALCVRLGFGLEVDLSPCQLCSSVRHSHEPHGIWNEMRWPLRDLLDVGSC